MPTPSELEKLSEMYHLAKDDESKRDLFVEEVAFTLSHLYHKGVSEIIYDPAGREYFEYAAQMNKDGIMSNEELNELEFIDGANFAVLAAYSTMGKKRRNPIFTMNNAFKIESLDEFLNVLVDHEARHAEDLMNGINICDYILLDYRTVSNIRFGTFGAIAEVRADQDLIAAAQKKGLTDTKAYFRAKQRMRDQLSKIKTISEYPSSRFEECITLEFLDGFYRTQQHKSI